MPDGCGDLRKTYGPEDVFHYIYIYAVFHSPTYRSRYAEFLTIDFPRLPLMRDVALFLSLCALGKELMALHLMERLPKLETRYPEVGDNTVDTVRYSEPAKRRTGARMDQLEAILRQRTARSMELLYRRLSGLPEVVERPQGAAAFLRRPDSLSRYRGGAYAYYQAASRD